MSDIKPVSLSKIVIDARVEGDMEVSETEIVECLNRCIATINASLSTKLPAIDLVQWMTNYAGTEGYEYIVCNEPTSNDILLRSVIYPYVIYDFKRKAEQNTYAESALATFNTGLSLFRGKYLSHLKEGYGSEINETDNYTQDNKPSGPQAHTLFPAFFKRNL